MDACIDMGLFTIQKRFAIIRMLVYMAW
jgi:hypothetical protein